MKKTLRMVSLALVSVMLLAAVAFATDYVNAHCIVPAFNGSGYSQGAGTKERTGSSAYLYNVTVGGGYEVDARQADMTSDARGAWARNLSSRNTSASLPGTTSMYRNDTIQVEFSNDLTTTVSVEVNGRFDTN